LKPAGISNQREVYSGRECESTGAKYLVRKRN